MSVEHVVFFPAPDGSPAFRRLPSLDEVVSFVEHLRNERDVREVSVHTLTQVPLNFRTIYRVEVAGEVPGQADGVPAASAMEPAVAPVAAPDVEPVDAPAVVVAADATPEPAVEPVAEPTAEAPVEAGVNAGGERTLGFFN